MTTNWVSECLWRGDLFKRERLEYFARDKGEWCEPKIKPDWTKQVSETGKEMPTTIMLV